MGPQMIPLSPSLPLIRRTGKPLLSSGSTRPGGQPGPPRGFQPALPTLGIRFQTCPSHSGRSPNQGDKGSWYGYCNSKRPAHMEEPEEQQYYRSDITARGPSPEDTRVWSRSQPSGRLRPTSSHHNSPDYPPPNPSARGKAPLEDCQLGETGYGNQNAYGIPPSHPPIF